MFASDLHELLHLLGRCMRVRNGRHSFEGVLTSKATRKFQHGNGRYVYGLAPEGDGYRFEFAWWDWYVAPLEDQPA